MLKLFIWLAGVTKKRLNKTLYQHIKLLALGLLLYVSNIVLYDFYWEYDVTDYDDTWIRERIPTEYFEGTNITYTSNNVIHRKHAATVFARTGLRYAGVYWLNDENGTAQIKVKIDEPNETLRTVLHELGHHDFYTRLNGTLRQKFCEYSDWQEWSYDGTCEEGYAEVFALQRVVEIEKE